MHTHLWRLETMMMTAKLNRKRVTLSVVSVVRVVRVVERCERCERC